MVLSSSLSPLKSTSFFTLSLRLLGGLPLFLFPETDKSVAVLILYMDVSKQTLYTSSRSRPSLNPSMPSTPATCPTFSFVFCSEMFIAHLIILISVRVMRSSYVFFRAHISAPFTKIDCLTKTPLKLVSFLH